MNQVTALQTHIVKTRLMVGAMSIALEGYTLVLLHHFVREKKPCFSLLKKQKVEQLTTSQPHRIKTPWMVTRSIFDWRNFDRCVGSPFYRIGKETISRPTSRIPRKSYPLFYVMLKLSKKYVVLREFALVLGLND